MSEVIQDDLTPDLTTQPGSNTFKQKITNFYSKISGSTEENIINCCYNGDCIGIMKYKDNGENLDINDKCGNTLLHIAVKGRQGDMIQFLVNLGMDINCVNAEGITPLMYAIELGFDDISLDILQIKSLDLEHWDHMGRTALHYCALYGNAVMANILLENGIDVDKCDINGYNALHICCECNCFNVAKVLLRWHIDLEKKNKYGFIPLGTAVNHQNRNMVRLITAAMRGTDHKNFEQKVDDMLGLTCDINHYNKVLEEMPLYFKGGQNDFEEIRPE
ncbi:hypothetical protein ENUP19_0181G0011 [Entamoeba nuttalli]|uniref:Ankyrin repeat protein, putative n=2 Tax=Entamoeba nuttalli TaxID=412467 RepID=K2GYV8_ENTNP|nr:ankyrin repeat protein, putative [Entamoeba nuttalli P19]EKE39032.1 ankyrin repeat protein, putative [Entamoeba nuttalli P19]|eukprot:XP_008858636.1 ankyrin repeat protein, putative [Entamoeba nuttalli P19]